ncbi:hypothetical protein GCM10011349_20170 [Novosphingobium indicum]|uniref:VRR-NUC domain-containing protein n=1 Tax=Novosphingobium indicum TaxID=462949 RepID=A0ABQ2JQ32_9SPHN|nr:hypothetical protein [Novosphingobium indicum]GGN49497.1 hypothetical protein GCM10011349_20170 [Novosphingobium indicum]
MPTPAFLVRLMQYRGLSRSVRIGPEDSECLAFATELRAAALEGRLRAVFTHPANELAGMVRKGPGGKVIVPAQVALARALGLITGTADYLFMMCDSSLAIEFKSKNGSMTEGQKDFRDWCEAMGVPHHVVRSAEGGLQILRDAGVLS